MSFNDIARNNSTEIRPGQPVNISKVPATVSGVNSVATADASIHRIGDLLKSFQADCNATKQKMEEIRMKHVVTANDISEIDKLVQRLRGSENNVKIQIDQYLTLLETLPRNEATPRRITVVKLKKDFDRVKEYVQNLYKDINILRSKEVQSSASSSSQQQGGMSQFTALKTIQGHDVDQAIIEEREKDIMQINKDLILVNEMFRDMAHMVEAQGETIEKIAEDTESSRERAEAGLKEVTQAAAYQPVCIMS